MITEPVAAEDLSTLAIGTDTVVVVLIAGLLLLWGLLLGIWKYHGIATSPDHRAHVYVDIAHRAALMYAFATLVLAALVAVSAWPSWVNLTAAIVPVVFFVGAIASYVMHGAMRDTDNQFARPAPGLGASMIALIIGEVGGCVVLLAGVVATLVR
ncbi:hypothetical protein AAFP30_01030 [Gordonia sp. CPCC 205515]|uniref:hypothetical protein n=1 Tax=Gordonia sp. CPCC 205515 TaxID=3140791 RepID=UPI003AF3B4B6